MPHTQESFPSQPSLRAFPIFDDVPIGHYVYPVIDRRHEPHLRRGEFVVIDAADRDCTCGELYMVLQSNGPIIWQIVKLTRGKVVGDDRPHVVLCPLQHVSPMPKDSIMSGINLSDGPYAVDDLKNNLLGRVVGLINPRERFERKWREAYQRRAGR